jgi:hypothetical protein
LGYVGETDTQVLLTENVDEPTWQDGKVCYSMHDYDGLIVFNEEAAREIRVNDQQHLKRAEGSAALMAQCIQDRPMPEQGADESVAAWEDRTLLQPFPPWLI